MNMNIAYTFLVRGETAILDTNIRRAEHSRAMHVSFILEARGSSRAETFDVQEIPNMDKPVAEPEGGQGWPGPPLI